MSKDTHNCLLTRQTQTSSFAPQHPSANWHGKLLHCIKKWLTLNENDIRCRNFLKTGSALRAEQRKHSREPTEIYYVNKRWIVVHMESKADVYRYFHNIYIKRIQLTTEAALRRRRTGQDVRDLLKTGSILEKRRKRTINIE
uniref:Uncharacterized protein LOC114336291 n=1 Tax=Diabrotica virgifera virgifera TaxID=50390 RepID=A0A6P7G0M2_DIAVI